MRRGSHREGRAETRGRMGGPLRELERAEGDREERPRGSVTGEIGETERGERGYGLQGAEVRGGGYGVCRGKERD